MSSATTEPVVVWDRHAIRAAIARRGATLARVARDAGLSAGACSLSLCRPSPSGDAAIAAYLDVPLHKLWPDRYDANGNRIIKPRRRRAQGSPPPPPPDEAAAA